MTRCAMPKRIPRTQSGGFFKTAPKSCPKAPRLCPGDLLLSSRPKWSWSVVPPTGLGFVFALAIEARSLAGTLKQVCVTHGDAFIIRQGPDGNLS